MTKVFNIAAAALILLLAVGLYKAKTEADVARARVAALQAEVDAAQSQVNALKAESAFLDNPDRIETLAKQQLGLKHAAISQHKSIEEIDRALPAPAKSAAKPKAAP